VDETIEKNCDAKHHNPLEIKIVSHNKDSENSNQRHDYTSPNIEEIKAEAAEPKLNTYENSK
jgi:hypothetical protein